MSALARAPRRRPAEPVALSPGLRTRIENAIEHLIILLDALDRDADLEPDADAEPEEDQDESEERVWWARPGARMAGDR